MTTDVRLLRVTDAGAAAPCEDLFREYVGWVGEQLLTRHGVEIDAAETEIVHDAFRTEWPKLFGPTGRMYLVVVDGEPAAVGTLKPVSAETAELKRMYVRPAHRCLGLGRRLVRRIVDDARLLGFRTVRLETFTFMTGAHALYRAAGFVDTAPFDGSEAAEHGVDGFELFMALDLASS